MKIDVTHWQFWLAGFIWLTPPILSWLWSLASIKHYRRFVLDAKEFRHLYSEIKDDRDSYRTVAVEDHDVQKEMLEARTFREEAEEKMCEARALREKAEEELKCAREYYDKIAIMLENNAEEII